jgi:hypothetical protein
MADLGRLGKYMKTPKIALACFTLQLGGCVLIPAPYSGQLNPVADLCVPNQALAQTR